MKTNTILYILVGFLFAGIPNPGQAQRLCIKTNLPAWGCGHSNMEMEWMVQHPFSYNLGYIHAFTPQNPSLTACWLDYRYWFSGRVSIGTAIGIGGLLIQESTRGPNSTLTHQQGGGINCSILHGFTLHARWSLELKLSLGLAAVYPNPAFRLEMRHSSLSLTYILQ